VGIKEGGERIKQKRKERVERMLQKKEVRGKNHEGNKAEVRGAASQRITRLILRTVTVHCNHFNEEKEFEKVKEKKKNMFGCPPSGRESVGPTKGRNQANKKKKVSQEKKKKKTDGHR